MHLTYVAIEHMISSSNVYGFPGKFPVLIYDFILRNVDFGVVMSGAMLENGASGCSIMFLDPAF